MIITEDGTGVTGANSYVSVAQADAYFEARGVAGWLGTDETKQAALIRASDYIDIRWSGVAPGARLSETQGLAWPRCKPGMPHQLARACFEYALIGLTTELAPAPVVDASGVTTIVSKQQVGPLVKEFAAVGGDAAVRNISRFRSYPIADGLMINLLGTAGGWRRVYR